jgi:hypothetical protein
MKNKNNAMTTGGVPAAVVVQDHGNTIKPVISRMFKRIGDVSLRQLMMLVDHAQQSMRTISG